MLNKFIFGLLILLCLSIAYADKTAESGQIIISDLLANTNVTVNGISAKLVKNSAPRYYIVKKNDTVVRLAQMYLKKSGYWPQFLGVKSLAATKLYPGDQLNILAVNGYKMLGVTRAKSTRNYEKLMPTVTEVPNNELPPISTKLLRNLFLHPTVMDEKIFESLPSIVAGENIGQLYYTAGDTVYVKGYSGEVGDNVAVFSKFRRLFDPDTKEDLGYEVRYNGDGVINQIGPVSSLELINVIEQVSDLDKVAQLPDQLIPTIVPHKPEQSISGKIIALYDVVTSTASGDTVVINRGSRDGVEIGQVYDINSRNKIVDPTLPLDDIKYLTLPTNIIGELLIYKVYDKVAFGLVTDASRPIELYAQIQSQR